jgi:hypothetical protein
MSEISQILDKALEGHQPETEPPKPPKPMKALTEIICPHCGRSDFKNKAGLAGHMYTTHRHLVKRVQNHPANKAALKKLTATEMLEEFPGVIRQVSFLGVRRAFEKHPEWEKTLLPGSTPRQSLYDAVNRFRHAERGEKYRVHKSAKPNLDKLRAQHKKIPMSEHQKPVRKYKKQGGSRIAWSREQFDLAKAILNAPQWRKPGPKGVIDWARAFDQHPEWAKVFGLPGISTNTFQSFIGRVRNGQVVQPEASTNGEPMKVETPVVFRVLGRDYSLTELEVLIKAQQNALTPLGFCPRCGLHLKMHTKAYSIAVRHGGEEEV